MRIMMVWNIVQVIRRIFYDCERNGLKYGTMLKLSHWSIQHIFLWAALNRPVRSIAINDYNSCPLREQYHCLISFYITPRILWWLIYTDCDLSILSVVKLSQKLVEFESSCNNQISPMAVQCTLQSSSQGISRLFPRQTFNIIRP